MKKILLLIFILCLSSFCYAEDYVADKETKEICNQVMQNIYNEILAQGDNHEELSLFDEKALSLNQYGIYQIEYRYDYPPDPLKEKSRKKPFVFGLTINQQDDSAFQDHWGFFDFPLPALKLKFAGYQKKRLKRAEFNLLPFIEKNIYRLYNHQQKYLPLKVSVVPVKDTFEVRESVEFEVILENVSKGHMIVKLLDDTTLSFLVDNKFWGARSVRKKEPSNEREAKLMAIAAKTRSA